MIIIAVIVLFALIFIGMMNNLKRKQVKIDEASSGIDVALQKRFDSLTKMFDVAKNYAKFEKETVLETVKLRSGMTAKEKNDADVKMNKALQSINLVAEQYPELQANQQFVLLQKEIADVEEHIQAARRAYNANVSSLNESVVSFPTSVVAAILNIHKEEFFEAPEEKKQDPVLKF